MLWTVVQTVVSFRCLCRHHFVCADAWRVEKLARWRPRTGASTTHEVRRRYRPPGQVLKGSFCLPATRVSTILVSARSIPWRSHVVRKNFDRWRYFLHSSGFLSVQIVHKFHVVALQQWWFGKKQYHSHNIMFLLETIFLIYPIYLILVISYSYPNLELSRTNMTEIGVLGKVFFLN